MAPKLPPRANCKEVKNSCENDLISEALNTVNVVSTIKQHAF